MRTRRWPRASRATRTTFSTRTVDPTAWAYAVAVSTSILTCRSMRLLTWPTPPCRRSQPLAAMGHLLGMRVRVVDDRSEWANPERFPAPTEISLVDYEPVSERLGPIPFPMTPNTYVIIATWGYDLPAMAQALSQQPAYI